MAGRDLSLTSRVEAVRETRRIPAPVFFLVKKYIIIFMRV